MVSLALAKKLKKNGLRWKPRPNDFFAIPDRGLDERIFVLSEMMTNIEQIRGKPMVSFHGSAEWATDYLITSEVVWLPRESQIRHLLQSLITEIKSARMKGTDQDEDISMVIKHNICICTIKLNGTDIDFSAPEAANAYALAYLHLSQIKNSLSGGRI